MTRHPLVLALVALVLAGAALAHSGVQNPAVMARMHTMSAIASEMKVLGEMTKGATPFNAAAARSAAAKIAEHAAETPALFEAPEDDPKSEAKPAIWDNFADFAEKSERLEVLALDLSKRITAKNDLAPAMKALGEACQACHKPYRE